MDRRVFLTGLSGSLAMFTLPARAASTCAFEGATIGAVTGPFLPKAFREEAVRFPNPGERLPVAENDMDLTLVTGATGVAKGQIVLLRGQVVTAGCRPVAGASVQLWQADVNGYYNHENERETVKASDLDPGFGYWGSTTADAEGRFVLRTIVPGRYPAGRGWFRPPHLHWTIGGDGLAPVTTQTYFDGDVLQDVALIRETNEADLILNLIQGFEGGRKGEALERARKRVRAENVARFVAGDDGVPVGELTLRVV